MFAILPALALVVSPSGASPPQRTAPATSDARERQWVYRPVLGDGRHQPTAAFLSWDYSEVIFTASCDRRTGYIVLHYYLRPEWDATGVRRIELTSGERSVELPVARGGHMLEGRTRLTPPLRALLAANEDIEIDAPNDMGEPWYVGRAAPLRRVALGCG